jgi:CopG family nickel-responsive transcriptional regulator
MSELVRFSVSIEKSLYERMGRVLKKSGYGNRSEFIRDLVRGCLVDEEWKDNQEALGTITLIYDHHKRMLSDRLTDLQHHYPREILVSTHVHLDRRLCAEAILVKGRARTVEEIANQLRKEKGVLHASLAMGSTGKELT